MSTAGAHSRKRATVSVVPTSPVPLPPASSTAAAASSGEEESSPADTAVRRATKKVKLNALPTVTPALATEAAANGHANSAASSTPAPASPPALASASSIAVASAESEYWVRGVREDSKLAAREAYHFTQLSARERADAFLRKSMLIGASAMNELIPDTATPMVRAPPAGSADGTAPAEEVAWRVHPPAPLDSAGDSKTAAAAAAAAPARTSLHLTKVDGHSGYGTHAFSYESNIFRTRLLQSELYRVSATNQGMGISSWIEPYNDTIRIEFDRVWSSVDPLSLVLAFSASATEANTLLTSEMAFAHTHWSPEWFPRSRGADPRPKPPPYGRSVRVAFMAGQKTAGAGVSAARGATAASIESNPAQHLEKIPIDRRYDAECALIDVTVRDPFSAKWRLPDDPPVASVRTARAGATAASPASAFVPAANGVSGERKSRTKPKSSNKSAGSKSAATKSANELSPAAWQRAREDRALSQLENLPSDVVGIVLEPFVMSRDLSSYTPYFLEKMCDLLLSKQMFLCWDEAWGGASRLGPMWSHQILLSESCARATPDFITFGKSIGIAGLAACLTPREQLSKPPPVSASTAGSGSSRSPPRADGLDAAWYQLNDHRKHHMKSLTKWAEPIPLLTTTQLLYFITDQMNRFDRREADAAAAAKAGLLPPATTPYRRNLNSVASGERVAQHLARRCAARGVDNSSIGYGLFWCFDYAQTHDLRIAICGGQRWAPALDCTPADVDRLFDRNERIGLISAASTSASTSATQQHFETCRLCGDHSLRAPCSGCPCVYCAACLRRMEEAVPPPIVVDENNQKEIDEARDVVAEDESEATNDTEHMPLTRTGAASIDPTNWLGPCCYVSADPSEGGDARLVRVRHAITRLSIIDRDKYLYDDKPRDTDSGEACYELDDAGAAFLKADTEYDKRVAALRAAEDSKLLKKKKSSKKRRHR